MFRLKTGRLPKKNYRRKVILTHSTGSVAITPEVVQTVQQHVSYQFIWIRRTCDYS